MNILSRALGRPKTPPPSGKKRINLALQGGGAHGAFTWGVLDVLLEAQPTKQFVTVEQVAALALYLTSDVAASITGANLSIDGGWTAQ